MGEGGEKPTIGDKMTHYLVRLDKVGYIDPEQSYGVERRTFRSLNALMGWIQKEHGANVFEWGVQEYNLAHTRIPPQPSTFSWILGIDYPSVNIDCWLDENHKDCGKCEKYTFQVYMKNGKPPAGFSYSEKEEKAFAKGFGSCPNAADVILKAFGPEDWPELLPEAEVSLERYYEELGVPSDLQSVISRFEKGLTPAEVLLFADACTLCGERTLAAKLYYIFLQGNTRVSASTKGRCAYYLAKLYGEIAYINSNYDVMLAVELYDDVAEGSLSPVSWMASEAIRDLATRYLSRISDGEKPEMYAEELPSNFLCFAGYCFDKGYLFAEDKANAQAWFKAARDAGYSRAERFLN